MVPHPPLRARRLRHKTPLHRPLPPQPRQRNLQHHHRHRITTPHQKRRPLRSLGLKLPNLELLLQTLSLRSIFVSSVLLKPLAPSNLFSMARSKPPPHRTSQYRAPRRIGANKPSRLPPRLPIRRDMRTVPQGIANRIPIPNATRRSRAFRYATGKWTYKVIAV